MTKYNHKLFINGCWREGRTGRKIKIINPATVKEIGTVACADKIDLDDALASAEAATKQWAMTPPLERGKILISAARLLENKLDAAIQALSQEQGKTLSEARGEYERVTETLEWNGKNAETLTAPLPMGEGRVLSPEPIGVVAALTPWNYPAVLNARKLAAALAAGCPVILKGSEETPSSAVFIIEALAEAGVPSGIIGLVFGDPPQISSHLLNSTIVKALSFTGSTAVGIQLAALAAENLQRCVLELGGHSPVIVYDDANIDEAVSDIVSYKFECAGQSCNAPSRVIVQEGIYDAFLAKLVAQAEKLKIGPGNNPETQMGPMVNARRIDAMERLTKDAIESGANVETGGARLDRTGFYWPPTILTNVNPNSAVMVEEPFGPILTVSSFDDTDDAIEQANATEYGLASYVYSSSKAVIKKMIRNLSAGAVSINHLRGVSADVPNAGINQSGYGYEGGELGFRAFQNLKLVNGV